MSLEISLEQQNRSVFTGQGGRDLPGDLRELLDLANQMLGELKSIVFGGRLRFSRTGLGLLGPGITPGGDPPGKRKGESGDEAEQKVAQRRPDGRVGIESCPDSQEEPIEPTEQPPPTATTANTATPQTLY